MRWSPLFAAALTPILSPVACGWGGDDSAASASASAGGSGGSTGSTTEPTSGGQPPDFWLGVTCDDEKDEGPPRFYFDLDAGTTPELDFFRLPFPLDARRTAAGIDLTGFPRPPADLDPAFGQVVERWLDYIEADTAGFAVNSAVLFRASHGVEKASGIHYLNLTPGHPDYGKRLRGYSFSAETGPASRNNYICSNWLSVETIDGYALDPGTTYGVLLTDEMKPLGGGSFEPDADFAAMLADASPAGASAAAAWQTFAPLRTFLTSPENLGPDGPGLSRERLIAGAVFTTAPNRDIFASARDAARAAPLYVHDLHLCSAAGEGPCGAAPGLTEDEARARRCGPPSAQFREIHGRVRLPVFQEGLPPYAELGGRIDLKDGAPLQRSSVDACFSVTLPPGPAPAAGYPALIYAHGTGGSFRSAIAEGVAPRLAALGVATIALEGVLHGERRGDTDADGEVAGLDLEQLAFNVFNPESARDTMIQGAIDQFSAVRLAEAWHDSALLPGEKIAFDPGALVFMGHSQGATAGALFLPFEPLVRAAVLSGGGANLVRAILAKEHPETEVGGDLLSPRELLQLAFQERPDRPLTSDHPMLVLLNTYANRSDVDNTSRLLRRQPRDGVAPKHLLLYLGHVDGYTPLRAAGNLAIGAGTQIGGTSLFPGPCDPYEGPEATACSWTTGEWLTETALPASANLGGVTAVVRMLRAPAGADGHYVAFQAAELERIAAFLHSALTEPAPTVP